MQMVSSKIELYDSIIMQSKHLEARVYLWEGSKESIDKALNATEEIITAIGDNGIVMDDMYTYSYLLPEISQSNRSLASGSFI